MNGILRWAAVVLIALLHAAALPGGAIAQDARLGASYSQAELEEAAENHAKCYDRGLSAEWLLYCKRIEQGFSRVHSMQVFTKVVRNRIGVRLPEWYVDGMLKFSSQESDFDNENRMYVGHKVFNGKSPTRIGGASIPRELNGAKIKFGLLHEGTHLFLGTSAVGVSSNLVVKTTGESGQRSLSLQEWCPVFADLNISDEMGVSATDFPQPCIQFLPLETGEVVVLGIASGRCFLSVLSRELNQCKTCFVTWHVDDAVLIDSATPQRADYGG